MSEHSVSLQRQQTYPQSVADFSQTLSHSYLQRAKRVIPQGVGSPGRAFDEVHDSPIFVSRAQGSRIWDVDGNVLVDFMNGLGPIILGHANEAVLEAIIAQSRSGTVHALCSEMECQLAAMIAESTPEIEKVRFACSGTEAVMTAVRLSRLVTGRPKVVKFRGAYHGHSDQVLAPSPEDLELAGDRMAVWKGIPREIACQTIYAEYNDLDAINAVFAEHGKAIAAVLVEPIATNMGLVPGTSEFLNALRHLCSEYGSLLVCDEVVNGFRFRYGAYTQDLGFAADLYTFGKIIGGGLPIGALAGPSNYMNWLESHTSVFHSGTFASNPVTMVAGIAVLDQLRSGKTYEALEGLGAELEKCLAHELDSSGSSYGFIRRGSVFSLVLVPNRKRLYSYAEVSEQDTDLFANLHQRLLRRGILIPPTIEEPGFISSAHSVEDVRALASAVGEFLAEKSNLRQG